MCYYSAGYKYYDIKPIMHWRAEQHKRQRILRYEKTGFWVVGIKYLNYNEIEIPLYVNTSSETFLFVIEDCTRSLKQTLQ